MAQFLLWRLRYRKLRRRLLYAAAVLIPLFLFAGLFWQMDRRFDLLVDAGMQEIVVPKGERMQVVFQDGSRVHLNAGSRIRYPKQFGWSERRVELSGEGWFEVSKNAKRPFIVELGLMDIKVLGTTFDVKAYEEDQMIMITLETGSIEVNASNYESFRMEPGDKALYDKSSRRFEIHRSSDVTKYSTWREDRLVFRSEPLREVLNTISRNYNIEFEVKDTGEIQKVVMKDEAAPEETPEEPQNPVGTDAPKTGDDTNLLFWTALLGIGLCGTGAAFVMRRKRR